MKSSNILEIEKVDQIFRAGFWLKSVQVLHGVDLDVPEGSIFGFLGANGAGKTTLIQLIAGLRRPTQGSVRIQGFAADSREARRRIGYLPERPYFYEHLTGEAFLRLYGTLSGMKRAQLDDRISSVLKAVGMEHARDRELKRYSKGMLQRIGIAQAILHDPPFLVLDEPMSGLDPLGRKEIRELILALAAEGRTIFFSTHVIPDVEAICDQVALIQRGRVLGCGPIAQFLPSTGSVEIIADLKGEAPFGSLGDRAKIARLHDGLWKLTIDDEAAGINAALAGLIERKAAIVSVNAVRPSLESFFEKGVS